MGLKKAKVGDYVAAGQGDPVVFWHRKFLRYSVFFCLFSLLVFEICVDTVRIVEHRTDEDSASLQMTMVAYHHSAESGGDVAKDKERYALRKDTVCDIKAKSNESSSLYDFGPTAAALENWNRQFDQVILLVDAMEACPQTSVFIYSGRGAAECHEHGCPLIQDAYPEMQCMVERMQELSSHRYIVSTGKMDTVFVTGNNSVLREALSRGREYFRKFIMVGHRKAVEKADYCHAIQNPNNHDQGFGPGVSISTGGVDVDALAGHAHVCRDIDYIIFAKGSIHSKNTPSFIMGPDGWEVFLVDSILRSNGMPPIIDIGNANGSALGLSGAKSLQPSSYDSIKQYNENLHRAFLHKSKSIDFLGRKAGTGGSDAARKQGHSFYSINWEIPGYIGQSFISEECI